MLIKLRKRRRLRNMWRSIKSDRLIINIKYILIMKDKDKDKNNNSEQVALDPFIQ